MLAPTRDAVAWAVKIVTAFDDLDNAAKGAIRLDGETVEILHLDEARRTLALAEALAQKELA